MNKLPRPILYTQTGQRHRQQNTDNQDRVLARHNRSYSVVVLSDGVSACPHGGEGAEIACRVTAEMLLPRGGMFMSFGDEKIAEFSLGQVLSAIRDAASAGGAAVSDYGCTLSWLLVENRTGRLLSFRVGDGLILSAGAEGCRVLAQPDDSTRGCCVVTTAGAAAHCCIERLEPEDYSAAILFSDGAWPALYSGTRLRSDAAQWLAGQRFGILQEYLRQENGQDDCSFAAIIRNPLGGCVQ